MAVEQECIFGMMTRPLLITLIAEAVLLAAAGAIGHFLPISSPWIWLGVIAIGVPLLVAVIWRERRLRRSAPSGIASQAHADSNQTLDAGATDSDTVTPSSTPDRVDIHHTPKTIIQAARGRTSIAIDKLAKTYVGKWMTIDGAVSNVSDLDKDISLSVMEDMENELPYFIFMRFSKKQWMPHLEMLEKGDRIKARGEFVRLDRRGITLENCELLHKSESISAE